MENDERFKHIATDPKFRRIPKLERKVKIDKRFKSMFNDKKFKVKYTVDKRGRPVNQKSTEDLKRYYDLDESDISEGDEEEVGKYVRAPVKKLDELSQENKADLKLSESIKVKRSDVDCANEGKELGKFIQVPLDEPDELNKRDDADEEVSDVVKAKLKNLEIDYARGEGVLVTDSSSGDESDSEQSEEDFDHGWGELDKDAERTNELTNRLAVCNMDWDRIRASDLMILFHSFLPPNGVIESITIYPSDYGLERMKEEEIKGPNELVQNPTTQLNENDSEAGSDQEESEGSQYHMEKLRQYQLNRLKYYYAVVVCDCIDTANKIYTECDGLEFESSATKIDLRFIPEGTEFENTPKEICTKLPERYNPKLFTTTALQQGKVELTWDETNQERLEITKKLSSGKVDDVSEMDLHTYLASSSDEEDEADEQKDAPDGDENPVEKYKALLQDLENAEAKKKGKDIEMEISWGLDLKEKTQKLVKEKLSQKEEKTPFEQFIEKRKVKQKAKREERKKKFQTQDSENSDDDIPSDIDLNDPYFAEEFDKPEFKTKKSKAKPPKQNDEENERSKAELELLLLDEQESKHFNLKQIQERENPNKKKRKNKEAQQQEDDFKLDVNDDRFSALFSSHLYNIDPTDPHFRKTKAMETLMEEKLKRRNDDSNLSDTKKQKTSNKDAELSVLVKSVKRKTQNLTTKKIK